MDGQEHSWGLYIFHYLGISGVALIFAKTGILHPWACYLLSAVMGFALGYGLELYYLEDSVFQMGSSGYQKKEESGERKCSRIIFSS